MENTNSNRVNHSLQVTSKRNSKSYEETIAYWTKERMNSAIPVELEHPEIDIDQPNSK